MSEPITMPQGHFKLSLAEYLELPNDGKRYEILDGDLYATPAPVTRHQRISKKLQTALILALEETGLGEVYDAPIDVLFDEHSIAQPDIIFIRAERLKIIGEKRIEGPPDLVVEIFSPSTRR